MKKLKAQQVSSAEIEAEIMVTAGGVSMTDSLTKTVVQKTGLTEQELANEIEETTPAEDDCKTGSIVCNPLDNTPLKEHEKQVEDGLKEIAKRISQQKEIKLTSAIKEYKSLVRLAEEATRNEDVKREIDHLIYELNKDNLEAGLGYPGHIRGTNIFYLRGRRGGRLYYHKIYEREKEIGYEIVGKSSKNNQNKVIKKLQEIYS